VSVPSTEQGNTCASVRSTGASRVVPVDVAVDLTRSVTERRRVAELPKRQLVKPAAGQSDQKIRERES
jgi:hypothetical protein